MTRFQEKGILYYYCHVLSNKTRLCFHKIFDDWFSQNNYNIENKGVTDCVSNLVFLHIMAYGNVNLDILINELLKFDIRENVSYIL